MLPSMLPAAASSDESLFDLLSEHAHVLSTRRLLLSLGAGAVAILGAVLAMSLLAALLAALGGCQLAFGLWGLADRRLETLERCHSGPRTLWGWRVARALAAVTGAASGLLLVNLLAFGFIGRWIS